MNCLSYALHFWKKEPDYKIWYNSSHCINLPMNSSAIGFLPIEEFGYSFILSSFNKLLSEEDLIILKDYFKINLVD